MADGAAIHVLVVYSPAPREVFERLLVLVEGACVRDALQASHLLAEFPALAEVAPLLGVWGRKAKLNQILRDQDRIEIYRPLTVDPKVARRERFQSQGSRGAGLFAQRRPGSKSGY